jgi:hypothetical protein
MTTTIDATVDKFIVNKYYEVWKKHPKFNKQESFWRQFYDLYIDAEVEGRLVNSNGTGLSFSSEENLFTEEQINSIGWEERFEIIHFIAKEMHYDYYSYEDQFQTAIRSKNWKFIFTTYSQYYASYHFRSCSSLKYLFFDMVLADFKFKTAIAKIKRNQIFILGLSMKLSMRDCGIQFAK